MLILEGEEQQISTESRDLRITEVVGEVEEATEAVGEAVVEDVAEDEVVDDLMVTEVDDITNSKSRDAQFTM